MEQLNQGLQRLKLSTASTTQNLYDQVQLTPEEAAAALQEAKEAKYWRLEDQRKKIDRQRTYEEALRPWTTAEMFQAAQRQAGPEYQMDQYSEPVFKLLAQYFAADPEFQKDGRNLQKGILLMGSVGVGKTELLKAFRYNKRCCFLPESCNKVELFIRERGLSSWNTYTGFIPGHGGTKEYFFQSKIGWMMDDLGTEEPILDYGNKLDAMEKIISQRYLLKDQLPFFTMHLTTNLNGDMLNQRYGQRATSRIREMYNIIHLGGKDRRI